MTFPVNAYKIIAVVSFLILAIVHFVLIFNTYELVNRQYNLNEKGIINEQYGIYIRNELLFPGGSAIIDRYIYNNIQKLEDLYRTDRHEFDRLCKKVSDSLFAELRNKSPMDRIFNDIIRSQGLSDDLLYLLTVQSIKITFDGKSYIPLFNKDYRLVKSQSNSVQIYPGIPVSGTLQSPNAQNEVTILTVSSGAARSYQITFYLFADHNDRFFRVLKEMLPTFVLSVTAIFAVLFIYFVTFRNWVRQKKLAEMKSDFVNSITHEFHTPISTIMVASKSLQNEKIIAKKENVKNLTAVIGRQIQRLQILFDQVLDITRISRDNFEKQTYELNDLLDELILDYRLKLTDEKVQLSFSKGANIRPVKLNRFWFTTMLYNLFNNAVKYNDKTEKSLCVETISGGEHSVSLHIRDNGTGISEQNIEYIFDKFFRGNKANPGTGLGLGLFYVKQCAEAHGWRISVSTEEGTGSEFVIHMEK